MRPGRLDKDHPDEQQARKQLQEAPPAPPPGAAAGEIREADPGRREDGPRDA